MVDGVGVKQVDDCCYFGFCQVVQGDFWCLCCWFCFVVVVDQMNVLVDKVWVQYMVVKINYCIVWYDIVGDVSVDGNNFVICEQNIVDVLVFWCKQVCIL